MNNNAMLKKAYRSPQIVFLELMEVSHLLDASFQGGHNGAVSGGDLGDGGAAGHNPGQSGGSNGDARRALWGENGWKSDLDSWK